MDNVQKIFAELLDSQLKRKTNMATTLDRSIAQLNALQGAMNELDEQIANTRCAYNSYMMQLGWEEPQPSTVDSSELATEKETQQTVEGLEKLAQPEEPDPLGGTTPKVAKVKPYTGKTANVWQAKNEAN